jgi:hypothetical protein
MNVVSQWWIGGLRTRKAKVMSSILMGGSQKNLLLNLLSGKSNTGVSVFC